MYFSICFLTPGQIEQYSVEKSKIVASEDRSIGKFNLENSDSFAYFLTSFP